MIINFNLNNYKLDRKEHFHKVLVHQIQVLIAIYRRNKKMMKEIMIICYKILIMNAEVNQILPNF